MNRETLTDRVPALDATELAALGTGLELTEGFALFIAVVDSPEMVARLREALDAERPALRFAWVDLGQEENPTDLAAALRRAWQTHAPENKTVIVLHNFDPALTTAPDVPTAFGRLNQIRNTMIAEVPCAWVFVLRPEQVALLRQHAPDLWSVRTSVFRFRLPAREVLHVGPPPVEDWLDEPGRYLDVIERIEREGRSVPPEFPGFLHLRAGNAWMARRDPERALSEYEKGLGLFQDLVEEHGRRELARELAAGYMSRGTALASLGRLAAAVRDYRRAIEIMRELVERQGRPELANDLAGAYENLGIAYGVLGRLTEAVEEFNRAIEIMRLLVERQGRRELASHLAKVFMHRGNAYGQSGRLMEAVGDLDRAIEIMSELVARQGRRELADDLAAAYMNRGNAYRRLGRLTDAMGDYDRAVEIIRDLVEHQGRRELANDLAVAFMNRGIAYRQLGGLREAVADYDRGIEIMRDLVERQGRRELANDLAAAYMNRALTIKRRDGASAALTDCQRALTITHELIAAGRGELRPFLLWSLGQAAGLFLSANRPTEAVRMAEEGMGLIESPMAGKEGAEAFAQQAVAFINAIEEHLPALVKVGLDRQHFERIRSALHKMPKSR
jgi:tetratricopeptide (TPR) repeat protein